MGITCAPTYENTVMAEFEQNTFIHWKPRDKFNWVSQLEILRFVNLHLQPFQIISSIK